MTHVLPPDFERASQAVLEFLHRRLGFSLWMVTRVQGDDFIILQAKDEGYGVSPGTVIRWADSFCSQMVKGNAPRVAPDGRSWVDDTKDDVGDETDFGTLHCPLVLFLCTAPRQIGCCTTPSCR